MHAIEIKLKKYKNAKMNPKAFFLYASSKCKSNDGTSDLKVDQRKISSDEGKANVLNQFFSSVFTAEGGLELYSRY
jgi:hypothetical protein